MSQTQTIHETQEDLATESIELIEIREAPSTTAGTYSDAGRQGLYVPPER